jgi:hypothetical protein
MPGVDRPIDAGAGRGLQAEPQGKSVWRVLPLRRPVLVAPGLTSSRPAYLLWPRCTGRWRPRWYRAGSWEQRQVWSAATISAPAQGRLTTTRSA